MLWLPKWLREERDSGPTSLVVPELAVTRRTFLFLGASAAAATLLPASPFDPVFTDPRTVDAVLKEAYLPWIADAINARPSLVGQFVLEDDGKHASPLAIDRLPGPMAPEDVKRVFGPKGFDRIQYDALRRRARETVTRLRNS